MLWFFYHTVAVNGESGVHAITLYPCEKTHSETWDGVPCKKGLSYNIISWSADTYNASQKIAKTDDTDPCYSEDQVSKEVAVDFENVGYNRSYTALGRLPIVYYMIDLKTTIYNKNKH